MEHCAFKDATLRIFREVLTEPEFRDWPDTGIAIQAYLRACERDLHELAAWARGRGTPVWVRLIKGAYWDTRRSSPPRRIGPSRSSRRNGRPTRTTSA